MLRLHTATPSWQFVRNDETVCGLMVINASGKVCPWHEIGFSPHPRKECRSAPGGGVAGGVGLPAFETAYLTPRAGLGYFLALKSPARLHRITVVSVPTHVCWEGFCVETDKLKEEPGHLFYSLKIFFFWYLHLLACLFV